MMIQIKFVADRGVPDRERLVLEVLHNVDIGDFILIRTGYEENEVTIDVVNTFWFPYKRVRRGDIVVVYSKSGPCTYKRKAIRDNRTAHFFYWGQNSALWDGDSVAPVLLYAPQWVSKAPEELVESA